MFGPDIALDFEFCTCDALTDEERELVLVDPPCCAGCPYCRRRVRVEYFDAHVLRHKEKVVELQLKANVLFPATPLPF